MNEAKAGTEYTGIAPNLKDLAWETPLTHTHTHPGCHQVLGMGSNLSAHYMPGTARMTSSDLTATLHGENYHFHFASLEILGDCPGYSEEVAKSRFEF